MKKSKDLIENFILFVILLVLIQTFVEDLAVLLGWSWSVRKALIFSGFGFDLFFSIEFITRYFNSLRKGKALKYMLQERGWVDLIASLPLLFLSSGPGVIALLQGTAFMSAAGMLNILKVVKTVRIARILRLLRLLKVFKKIKFVNSVMAQRHLTRIITTVISSFVIALTAASFILAFVPVSDIEQDFVEKHSVMAATAERLYENGNSGLLKEFDAYSSVLIMRTSEGTVYSRYDNDFYTQWFGPSDYGYVRSGDLELFYSLKPLYATESKNNLLIFVAILSMLIILMVAYTPHFALTVTDPVNIMVNGMSDSSYNLEVLIPENLQEDGIYKLARQYNEEYLPMKARNNDAPGQGGGLALKVDNIEDLFK
ncbi:MAG: ion transporter [Spirochaetales bacterium]|nr:ion transporter [Spirochaetales bacterium]